jgi:hypothetical protein
MCDIRPEPGVEAVAVGVDVADAGGVPSYF